MTEPQPFSQKLVLQICVVLLVLVALAGGYYESLNENWQASYAYLKSQVQQSPKPATTRTK